MLLIGNYPLPYSKLQALVPAAFAESPVQEEVSSRYKFYSTRQIIDDLARVGFVPFSAGQSKSRAENGKSSGRHLIRFRHLESAYSHWTSEQGGLIPELVLDTSHNGKNAFNFTSGVFRLVCTNGLIVGKRFDSISLRHSGVEQGEVIDAVFEVVKNSENAIKKSVDMSKLSLLSSQTLDFAERAINIRWDSENRPPIQPRDFLTLRRRGDNASDLFTVFNRVQENILRGGQRYKKIDYEKKTVLRSSVRAVQSIPENIRINRELWDLAEQFLQQA